MTSDTSNGRQPALPLRVAHVTTERGFGGGEVQVLLLMTGLAARGVQQTLWCPPGAAIGERARQRGFEVRELRMGSYLSFGSVLRLRSGLREHDIAHLHTGRASWLGSLAARLAGVPRVITRRTMRKVRPGWRSRLVYGGDRVAVVAISNSVADVLRSGGVDEARLSVVLDSVDLDRIPIKLGRDAVRAALGIAANEVLALGVGKLSVGKGFDVLVDAFAQLGGLPLKVAVAGDGPEREALAARIRDRGLQGRFSLLGQRSDVGDLLEACDLLVMPSRHEGLGNAAMEAMGRSRAVVTSRAGGLSELIDSGSNGLLVPPDDPAALASAIRQLTQDAAMRATFAAAGPARLDRGMRPAQGVDSYMRIYARCAAKA